MLINLFFSDPESGGLFDPTVQALSGLGGGEEVVPVGHDPSLQQQQRKQTNRSSGKIFIFE
jgi:hypothetical protein